VLVGTIDHIVLLFKLHDIEKNTLYLIGAFVSIVLYIGWLLAVAISILGFISLIHQYVALDVNTRRAQQTLRRYATYSSLVPLEISFHTINHMVATGELISSGDAATKIKGSKVD
jgi:uncharacterized metal-binding protein